jgi:hypothetical protein
MDLFEESENVDVELRVNKEYASRFQHNKQREEVHRRKLSLLFPSFVHNIPIICSKYIRFDYISILFPLYISISLFSLVHS